MIENTSKIISFDVGIKNMAYCVFEIVNSKCKIIDWNVVNLMDDSENKSETLKCTEVGKKNKKICNHVAKYSKGELCFCEKHAKMSNFKIPQREGSPTQLKKLKLTELFKIAIEHKIILDEASGISEKKPQLLEKIIKYYESISLNPIKIVKKNANEHSLIEIGKGIKREFKNISSMKGVQTVLIENQISPLASRMASIQSLVTQYFIMENDENQQDINIEFISSKNKLKMFSSSAPVNDINTTREKYKQHKNDGVTYAKQILSENPQLQSWISALETKKKDDLADCFLQGIWYIRDRKLSTEYSCT